MKLSHQGIKSLLLPLQTHIIGSLDETGPVVADVPPSLLMLFYTLTAKGYRITGYLNNLKVFIADPGILLPAAAKGPEYSIDEAARIAV